MNIYGLLGDILFTVATLFVYYKIIDNEKLAKGHIIVALCFAVAINVLINLPFTLPLFRERIYHDFMLLIFVMFTSKGKVLLKPFVFLISTAIVYGVSILSPMFVAILHSFPQSDLSGYILGILLRPLLGGSVFAMLSILVLATLIIVLQYLLKLGFLMKGILSWENMDIIKVGLSFSVAVLVIRETIVFILANHLSEEYHLIHPIVFTRLLLLLSILALICTISIFSWWRHHTVRLAMEKLVYQDMERYKKLIQDNEQLINNLKECNDALAENVHRDNKLIPATYMAVYDLICSIRCEESQEKARSLKIIEESMLMRKDVVAKAKQESNSLPTTGLDRIDNILNYMFSKANEHNISFELELTESIRDIIISLVSKEHLSTLLADLIENALIAISNCQDSTMDKKIMISMGVEGSFFEIDIKDSGIPFESETLRKLGHERATTHQNEGGSGIGYLTIFKILSEYKGSLIITEYSKGNQSFTKSVIIRFDGKADFVINCLEYQQNISITGLNQEMGTAPI